MLPGPCTRVCWGTLGPCLECPPWFPRQATSPSTFTGQEHGLQKEAHPRGGWRAGTHDSTGPITALNYLGPVIGPRGRARDPADQSECFPGTFLQRGGRGRPSHQGGAAAGGGLAPRLREVPRSTLGPLGRFSGPRRRLSSPPPMSPGGSQAGSLAPAALQLGGEGSARRPRGSSRDLGNDALSDTHANAACVSEMPHRPRVHTGCQ